MGIVRRSDNSKRRHSKSRGSGVRQPSFAGEGAGQKTTPAEKGKSPRQRAVQSDTGFAGTPFFAKRLCVAMDKCACFTLRVFAQNASFRDGSCQSSLTGNSPLKPVCQSMAHAYFSAHRLRRQLRLRLRLPAETLLRQVHFWNPRKRRI